MTETKNDETSGLQSLSARERRERIVQLAGEMGVANVAAIARQFNVTPSTVRRDLALLSSSGRLARTYGGAIATVGKLESTLAVRSREAYEQKAAIASWAVGQIGQGDSVLLDAGSTCALVARSLPADSALTVTTPSLVALNHVHAREDLEVFCLGGRLRATSDSFIGPLTESTLERMSFDIAFLGADSVLPTGEVVEADLEQTRLKELMARRARKVYVLVHASKLGTRTYKYSARFDNREWTIVTDWTADPEVLSQFDLEGINVEVVPAP
ncbi:DeoR/GlpR family DNA-binding transcription regulator [Pseudarthrobacter sp. NPDC055928]|uniref:DeoR/GlpR family DNA-binding transcription regulator n=1 Tax=Pseudarthrobacter sp. NPDC055928 TaxID=3345661 RepID=UPI0035DA7963